jgi:hypothetical protein
MSLKDAINDAQEWLNNNNPIDPTTQFRSEGFQLPPTVSSDGNGLPYSKILNEKPGKFNRKLITWFVPEFGIVKMYVNPEKITYSHKKLITPERTKGGFTLQYWGEDLTRINIIGTTGSSGVEGINMLYEIYRAEQYAEDSVGLSLAAANAKSDLIINAGGALGEAIGGDVGEALGSGILSGIMGADSPNGSALSASNIMTLAQLAFTVEMYYDGWVYRGYFQDMTYNEKANDFLWDYTLTFVATQRRGYRVNNFPWNKSANSGPSYSDPGVIPMSNVAASGDISAPPAVIKPPKAPKPPGG